MKKLCTAAMVFLLSFCLTACAVEKNSTYSDTQFCLDTLCTIKAGGSGAKEAVAKAFDLLYEIQEAADSYRPDSTVSKFNIAKANVPVSLDKHTFSILQTALNISQASGRAFSVTIAPLKVLWGFDQEPHRVPAEEEIQNALQAVDDNQLWLDETQQTLTKAKDGIQIDLGGAAKGYAADCVMDFLKSQSLSYAVVDLGGNVKVWGENPSSEDGLWSVGIQKPFGTKGECCQTLRTAGSSVVTSGTYQRNFTIDGVLYHHILDPSTGYPANNGYDSATVTADSALLADCLSTACMILSEDEARALAEAYGAQVYFHNR